MGTWSLRVLHESLRTRKFTQASWDFPGLGAAVATYVAGSEPSSACIVLFLSDYAYVFVYTCTHRAFAQKVEGFILHTHIHIQTHTHTNTRTDTHTHTRAHTHRASLAHICHLTVNGFTSCCRGAFDCSRTGGFEWCGEEFLGFRF